MIMNLYLLFILCFTFIPTVFAIDESGDQQQILAPGYGPLQFTAPAVGSYQLPVLGLAADGDVLDTHATARKLHQYMGDKVVLLSFIYSTCSDVNGCPLATMVFHQLKRRLSQSPELSSQLRLLTMSFNPLQDTPEVMKHYSQSFQDPGVDWQFLTARSEVELEPILQKYQQSIRKQYNEQGDFTGTFSHILRVYLIDRDKSLRNIYSVSFLHADTLVNDVKTLLQAVSEKDHQAALSDPVEKPETAIVAVSPLYLPGDNKQGYQQADYKTESIALTQRKGQQAQLIELVETPPLGLPSVPIPQNNPISPEKISLGRKLFYDRRLSLNNTFSCAMCHIPEQGFSSNEMATAVGIEGRTVRRNTPTLYNVSYASSLFHDGRESTLEQQVWGPLLAHNEMGNPSVGYVVDKINAHTDYAGLFVSAFGRAVSMETIGMAIASYERTLNSGDSAFDRWYFGKDEQAVSEAVKQGFELFTGKAGCSACHQVTAEYALLTDGQLHNTGVGFKASMISKPEKQRLQVAPGVYLNVDTAAIDSVSEPKANDLGRYEVTQDPQDRWRYKTPSLRNVALTAPYMHDGSLVTLKDVVEFYNRGGVANENLDSRIIPLQLSEKQINDLLAFLNSLTGSTITRLVADAFAAPVGDAR